MMDATSKYGPCEVARCVDAFHGPELCACTCHDHQRAARKPIVINWNAIIERMNAFCFNCATGFRCEVHQHARKAD